jgi:hypothetical protein
MYTLVVQKAGRLRPRNTMRLRLIASACAAGLILAAHPASAQTVAIPREKHAWGKFAPGAWIKVRKLTEELNPQGDPTNVSTTETKTTLLQLDEKKFVLQSEVTVEVSGKRFTAQPRTVSLGYQGETNGEEVSVRKLGPDVFDLGGVKSPCELLELTIGAGPSRVVSTVCYSNRIAPFVLRRNSKRVGVPPDQSPQQQAQVEVLAVDMPYRVLTELKSVAFVRTVQRLGKGSVVTVEVYCPDVPGGVVAHTSKELNELGHPVRRSTLELSDYGLGDDSDDNNPRLLLFHRRPRRSGTNP